MQDQEPIVQDLVANNFHWRAGNTGLGSSHNHMHKVFKFITPNPFRVDVLRLVGQVPQCLELELQSIEPETLGQSPFEEPSIMPPTYSHHSTALTAD